MGAEEQDSVSSGFVFSWPPISEPGMMFPFVTFVSSWPLQE